MTVSVRGALLVAVVAWSAAGCSKPSDGAVCGNSVCAAGTLCDPVSRLCVDNVEPVISVTLPAEGAALSGETVEVQGTISDDEGQIASAEVSLDDGASWTALSPGEDGAFSASLRLPKLDAKPLVVKLRAKDQLDQENTAQVHVTVDNVAPSCDPVFADGATLGLSTPSPFALQFRVKDGSGPIASVRLQINGVELSGGVIQGESASWQWDLPATDEALHTLSLRAQDPSGNACDLARTITVDRVPPMLTLESPAAGAQTIVGGPTQNEVLFNGKIADASMATIVTVDFKDGTGPRTAQQEAGSWEIAVPLPDEDFVVHDVEVRAVDGAGNAATTVTTVIVDTAPPTLTITKPAMNEKLNASSFAGGPGTVGVEWILNDDDPQTLLQYRQGSSGAFTAVTASPLPIQTSAQDNGASYTVELQAKDRAGNGALAAVTFLVDRRVPSVVSVSAQNASRMNPPNLSLTFDEPVTFQQGASVLSPAGATLSGAGTNHQYTGLLGDTVYTATLAAGAAQDGFGNPSAAGPTVTFHTAPAVPTSGLSLPLSVIMPGNQEVTFDAASDQDGVVTVVARTTSGNLAFGWFDPTTGAFNVLDNQALLGTVYALDLSAHRELSGLAALHYAGYTTEYKDFLNVTRQQSAWINGGLPVQKPAPAGTRALVLVPPSCTEPGGGPVGFLDTAGTYSRASSTSQPSGFAKPFRVNPLSAGYWHAFGAGSTGVPFAVHRACKCLSSPSCWFASSNSFPAAPRSVSQGSRWSSATSGGPYGIAVYDTANNDRAEVCYEVCPGPGACFSSSLALISSTGTLSQGLYVSPYWAAWSSGPSLASFKVLGARMTAGTGIELLQRELVSGCGSGWVSLGFVPGTATTSVTGWRPVLFAQKPGVIYQDGATLKVWIK